MAGMDGRLSVNAMAGSAMPSDRLGNLEVQPVWSLSRLSQDDGSQAEGGSRNGTILVDARQVGRWIIEQLEHYASRPGAMMTGIDPRMNATYPGSPTGV
jgi:hypothetical protein